MRRTSAFLCLSVLALALAGCGTNYPLPTQSRGVIPGNQTYVMEATWTGFPGIQDILLTPGSQLFMVFNQGGRDSVTARGQVQAFARLGGTGAHAPIASIVFHTLFNPAAMACGGDGLGNAANRLFVLDRGDTCLARMNVWSGSGSCRDTTKGWPNRVSRLEYYWHVREFGLLGGDTVSTFTDTTMAFVNGVAADAQGRVYVSGATIAYVPDYADPRLLTRTFTWRVNRYVRGPKAGGVPDPYMPGTDKWHVDDTWLVRDGSGVGTVVDPRGVFWGAYGGGAFYTADFGKGWVQKISDVTPSTGIFRVSGADNIDFVGPIDVVADPAGYVYLVDTGNLRVLRFDASGNYVQTVNVKPDAYGNTLQAPITVAADDSLVYVGDAGTAEVIRYRRLQ